jgi:acyl carrier protein
MSAQSWHSGIDAKVVGCWNLHHALLERQDEGLDFFLLISSISGSLGAIAQSNYCAANSFLDIFARYRRSLGLPAVSVGLGMITDVGYLSENPDVEAKLARSGISALDEKDMLLIIDAALSLDFGDISSSHLLTGLEHAGNLDFTTGGYEGSSPITQDPRVRKLTASSATGLTSYNLQGKRLPSDLAEVVRTGTSLDKAVTSHVQREFAQILDTDPDTIEVTKSLPDYGIDSMIATEIRTWLFRSFQLDVSLFQILSKTITIEILISMIVNEVRRTLDK